MSLKIATYIILAILGLVLIGLAIYVFVMPYPSSCKVGCGLAPPYLNGPQCLSVIETTLDPTIPAPTPIPYMVGFNQSSGLGPPYCYPVWYAYRYVRNSDGQYGPMSPWTGGGNVAIYAGAATLPCPPQGCAAFNVPVGTSTCTFNEPMIGILQAPSVPVNSADGYTLNVHRQLGRIQHGQATGFDPTSEGDIVGSINVIPGNNGITGSFVDTMNPKVTTASSCC